MNLGKLDCLIIGGGPAGLTAATYLARYHRNVAVVDGGHSRAALIPRTRNYPGFADGIAGRDLIDELTHQAAHYGVPILRSGVETLVADGGEFTASWHDTEARSKRIILATGLVDRKPPMAGLDDAVNGGTLRYCPICDGYEAMDRRIAVVGNVEVAAGKALFLRTYSKSVTLVPIEAGPATNDICHELAEAGVHLPGASLAAIERGPNEMSVIFSDGSRQSFDVIYPVLGCNVRSELAASLGARHDKVGCLLVDSHQRTTVNGLYAIGDVVSDLHQIAVATGHAAVAATDVHNSLPRNFR